VYDCVSVGSATQDVFVFSQGAQIHRLQTRDGEKAYLAFEYGAKVQVEQLFVTVGGGAVNTSVAMAKLGLRTGIVCELGQDDAGDMICRHLAAAGVGDEMVVRNPRILTGYSVIITGFDGDRTVLVHRGAACDLSRREIPWERLSQSAWVYLGSMTGQSAALWDDFGQFVRESQVKLAINPGSEQLRRGLDGLQAVLQQTEVIFVNREEAFGLAGVTDRHGDEVEFEALRRLHNAGCRVVVMTMGRAGARAYDGHEFHFCPAPQVDVVSNLGAGDSFASAFVAARFRGLDVATALRAGALNAAGVVSTMGATEGLQTWEQITATLTDVRRGGD